MRRRDDGGPLDGDLLGADDDLPVISDTVKLGAE